MKIIYTDGSSRGNGSKTAQGGFGVVVCEVWGDEKPEAYKVIDAYAEQVEGTTNNRMEMSALIWALKNYGGPEHRGNGHAIPTVYCDSMYCVNSFTNWIKNWKANGWRRAGNKPLENLDLIKEWDRLCEAGFKVNLCHVKGHSGIFWNEVADRLATGKISPNDLIKTT